MGNRGTIYIGRITGSLFTGVELDSTSIRDEEDSLVVATGPIIVRYDPREAMCSTSDCAVEPRGEPAERASAPARGSSVGFRHVFPDGQKKQRLAGSRSLGDHIVIDSAVLHDARFTVTDLWSPPDSLKGARRDAR